MGKTVTPFSIALSQQEDRFKKLRRALRAEDRPHLDAIFEAARLNIQAGVQAAAPDPLESVIILAMIEMHKKIQSLEAHISELKVRISELEEER